MLQLKILKILLEEPHHSQDAIAGMLGTSKPTISRGLASLQADAPEGFEMKIEYDRPNLTYVIKDYGVFKSIAQTKKILKARKL